MATLASRIGLIDSLLALILPSLANGFLIFLFRQFFSSIPDEFYEAAMMDGGTVIDTLVRIYLPLTKPVMITAGLVLFLVHWQSFFWPLIVIRSPERWVVQLAMATLGLRLGFPGSVITIALPVLLVLPLQRYFRLSWIEGGIR
jgi:ABC-type glycerol-3-phosphate transport system permease component